MRISKRALFRFFLIIGNAILLSCRSYTPVPEEVKSGFRFSYNQKPEETGPTPKGNGYYRTAHPIKIPHYTKPFDRDKTTYTSDTVYNYRVFYDDGTCLSFGLYSSDSIVLEHWKTVIHDPEGPVARGFYSLGDWGTYQMIHDTLTAHYLHHHVTGMLKDRWYAWEETFLITNDYTIQEIDPIGKQTEGESGNGVFNKKNLSGSAVDPTPAVFFPCRSIPKPDCWLKNEGWFMGTASVRPD